MGHWKNMDDVLDEVVKEEDKRSQVQREQAEEAARRAQRQPLQDGGFCSACCAPRHNNQTLSGQKLEPSQEKPDAESFLTRYLPAA